MGVGDWLAVMLALATSRFLITENALFTSPLYTTTNSREVIEQTSQLKIIQTTILYQIFFFVLFLEVFYF